MRFTVWDPFRDVAVLRRAMRRREIPYPPLDLVDQDDKVVVKAALPGVDRDEVTLSVLGDTLTIAGEKKLPATEDVTYIRHERPHGTFRRLVDMPYSVDQSKITATYKDGVLTITLPKAEEAKPRQIKVE
jgi:HSP20 family protein